MNSCLWQKAFSEMFTNVSVAVLFAFFCNVIHLKRALAQKNTSNNEVLDVFSHHMLSMFRSTIDRLYL